MLRPLVPALVLLAAPLAVPLAAAQVDSFAQRIAPFDVRGAADAGPLQYPFLGGFDEPKPQWVDLDGDGDDDLVVLDIGRSLLLFDNQGGLDALVPQPDALRGVTAPGGWFRFGDVDGDGDLDLLTNGDFGQVAYWRNDGSPQAATFTLAERPLLGTDGLPVGLEDLNTPDLADVDGDGDLDLLGGRTDAGTIVFYRHDGVTGGAPRYTFVTNTYGDLVIFEFDPQCPGTVRLAGAAGQKNRTNGLHGQNALTFVDIDADGDQDLFWGDFFSFGIRFFRSAGGADLSFVTEDYPAGVDAEDNGFFAPAFGDPDGDGDLDLLAGNLRGFCGGRAPVTRVANTLYYENVGSRAAPAYARRTSRLLRTLDLGTTTAPAVGDFDGDGDPDIVVGVNIDPLRPLGSSRTSTLHVLRNDGTPAAPSLLETETDLFALDFGLGADYVPAVGDLNGDGTPDLLVADFNGRFAVFLSPGGPAPLTDFMRADALLADVRQPGKPRPTLGDIDGDGDLDLLIGTPGGTVALWQNVGTAQAAAFERTNEDLLGAEELNTVAPAAGDLDGDGDADLAVGFRNGLIRLYRNDGGLQFTEIGQVEANARAPIPAFGDFDGDGDADLIVGTESGGLLYFESLRAVGNEPAPPSIRAFRAYPNPSSDGVTFSVGRLEGGGQIEMLDVLGRRVALIPVSGASETARWDGTAEPGLYIARLLTSDGRVEATTRLSVIW